MNILVPDWNTPDSTPVTDAFKSLGHSIIPFSETPRNFRSDPRFRKALNLYLQEYPVDCIFSLQFFPVLADICSRQQLPYISWCTQSPLPMTWHKSILHPTNYIFCYDSIMTVSLQELGACHVHYLPLAFHPAALTVEKGSDTGYSEDITFVGSLHSTEPSLAKLSLLSQSTLGYLEGILQAQQMIYGYPFLQNLLTPEILAELTDRLSLSIQPGGLESYESVFTNMYLDKILTRNERVHYLQKLAAYIKETESKGNISVNAGICIPEDTDFLGTLENRHQIASYSELFNIYRSSKINLNITNRSIYAGVPQKIFDAAAVGGFILSNFQLDMDTCFTEGTDYICYENADDMLQKLQYYLQHEEERLRIAEHAQKNALDHHSYLERAKTILHTISF